MGEGLGEKALEAMGISKGRFSEIEAAHGNDGNTGADAP